MKKILFGTIVGISSLISVSAYAASCPSPGGDISQVVQFVKKNISHVPSGDVDVALSEVKDGKKSSIFLVQLSDSGKKSAVGIVSCDKHSGDLKVLGSSWSDGKSDGIEGAILTEFAPGNSHSDASSCTIPGTNEAGALVGSTCVPLSSCSIPGSTLQTMPAPYNTLPQFAQSGGQGCCMIYGGDTQECYAPSSPAQGGVCPAGSTPYGGYACLPDSNVAPQPSSDSQVSNAALTAAPKSDAASSASGSQAAASNAQANAGALH